MIFHNLKYQNSLDVRIYNNTQETAYCLVRRYAELLCVQERVGSVPIIREVISPSIDLLATNTIYWPNTIKNPHIVNVIVRR